MTGSVETDTHSDELRQAAAAALADVDALKVEGDDRRIVLKALLHARLGVFAPVVPRHREADGKPRREPDSGASEVPGGGDILDKIGATLNLDRDTVELVYAPQDGEAHVVISTKKISSNKALAARQLGQLVAAARQITGPEEWTPAASIRKVVTDYGRLDSGNFAATIQQMDNVAVIRGRGQGREVKITKAGFEATADLIKSLTGAES